MAQKVSRVSIDVIEEKLKTLKKIIPECFTEGKIDLKKLEKLYDKSVESGGGE